MNPILEQLYPDKTVVARRRQAGFPPLSGTLDAFTAYVHDDMRACYLNGCDPAAIVTACVLIDFALKDAIHFDAFVKAEQKFNAKQWDQIDGFDFSTSINSARARGVVNKDECKQLHWLRKEVRNVYPHGQTPDWIKNKSEDIWEGNLDTGDVQRRTVSVRDNIVLQRQIRIVADRNV